MKKFVIRQPINNDEFGTNMDNVGGTFAKNTTP